MCTLQPCNYFSRDDERSSSGAQNLGRGENIVLGGVAHGRELYRKCCMDETVCHGWLHLTQDRGAFIHAHSSFWQQLLNNQRETDVCSYAIFTRQRLMDFFLKSSTLPAEVIGIIMDFAGRSLRSVDTERLRSLREKTRPLYTSLYVRTGGQLGSSPAER